MDPEVDHAPSTRKLSVIKPGLIRPIGVVKNQIAGINFPDLACRKLVADVPDRFRKTIRKVYTQEPIDGLRLVHNRRDLKGIAAQGLLTEDRKTLVEGTKGLLRMQSTWSCDYQTV